MKIKLREETIKRKKTPKCHKQGNGLGKKECILNTFTYESTKEGRLEKCRRTSLQKKWDLGWWAKGMLSVISL